MSVVPQTSDVRAAPAYPPSDEREQDQEPAAELWQSAPAATLVLAVLAVFYTLYLAREVLLPITFSLVLSLLLQPVLRFLTLRLRLPRMLAACLVTLVFLAIVGAVVFAIAVPGTQWLDRAPSAFDALRDRLGFLSSRISAIEAGLEQISQLLNPSTGTPTVAVKDAGLRSYLFEGTRAIGAAVVTIVVLLFFMLYSGDMFLRRLIEIVPRLRTKKRVIELADEIQDSITAYLLTVTTMNVLVGMAVAAAVYLEGLGDPLLWGTVAFLLNFIPIIGPLTGIGIFLVAGLLTLDSLWLGLLPAFTYLAIHVLEGELITPMLLARRFTLNPVLVVISIIVWHWMWGVIGALLAVPLLAMFKIVCDYIEPLKPLGHFIGATENTDPLKEQLTPEIGSRSSDPLRNPSC